MGRKGPYVISMFYLSLALMTVNVIFTPISLLIMYYIVGKVWEDNNIDIIKLVLFGTLSVIMTPWPLVIYAAALSIKRGKLYKSTYAAIYFLSAGAGLLELYWVVQMSDLNELILCGLMILKYLFTLFMIKKIIDCIIRIRFK